MMTKLEIALIIMIILTALLVGYSISEILNAIPKV